MRRTAALATWGVVAVLGVGMAGVAHGLDSTVQFRFQDQRITESSGLAQSLTDRNRIWTNNDSGDAARIYAVDNESGNTIATLDLKGATARDWEAMTTCRESDGDTVLWVGDIGDNIDGWKTYHFLAVDEPEEPKDGEVDWTSYDVRYEDGKAHNSEALLCHPKTGRMYLVTKDSEGGVYEGPSRMRKGETNVFEKIATAPSTVTDATFLADGKHAVLRGYREAWVVDVEDDWKVIATFYPPLQIQGETIAVAASGQALLFGSEGVNSSVYRVELPPDLKALQDTGDDLAGTQATPTPDRPVAEPSPTQTGDYAGSFEPLETPDAKPTSNSEGLPGISGPWVALFSALGLLAVVLALVSRRD